MELVSHGDTIVAGSNYVVLNYTGKVCDVSPYRDDYEPINDVPVVCAATTWQSSITGQVYILVLNEALWMSDSLNHTLINPNQLRYLGIQVHDDPTADFPLLIITEDDKFCIELHLDGTLVFANTHTPSDSELRDCPHIVLFSPHTWNPKTMQFR